MPGLHSELLTSRRPYQNPPNQASANPHKSSPAMPITASQAQLLGSPPQRCSTHLSLLFQARAHPLKIRASPVSSMPAAAFPAIPLRLLKGPTPTSGIIQEVAYWIGLQHPFLQQKSWHVDRLAGTGCLPTQPTPRLPGADPLVALIFGDLLHLLIHLLNILPAPLLPLLWEQDGTWLSERTTQLARQKRQGSPNSPRTDR